MVICYDVLDHNDVFIHSAPQPEAMRWLADHPGHRCRLTYPAAAPFAAALACADRLASAVLTQPALAAPLRLEAQRYATARHQVQS